MTQVPPNVRKLAKMIQESGHQEEIVAVLGAMLRHPLVAEHLKMTEEEKHNDVSERRSR